MGLGVHFFNEEKVSRSTNLLETFSKNFFPVNHRYLAHGVESLEHHYICAAFQDRAALCHPNGFIQ